MNSMVQKVARAICAEGSFCCQNGEAFCNAMVWYEDAARAAIEAMLEPNFEALIAGRDAILGDEDDIDLSTDDALACWQAMIRAALEAEGGRDG